MVLSSISTINSLRFFGDEVRLSLEEIKLEIPDGIDEEETI